MQEYNEKKGGYLWFARSVMPCAALLFVLSLSFGITQDVHAQEEEELLPAPFTSVKLSKEGKGSNDPKIAVDGQNVIAIWRDSSRIFVTRSMNGGVSFAPPVQLTTDGHVPSLAIGGQTVTVAWKRAIRSGFFSLMSHTLWLSRSSDVGGTLKVPIKISDDVKRPFESSMAIHEQTVIVAWDDKSASGDIWHVRSSNGGAAFSKPVNFPKKGKGAFKPIVAIHGQRVMIAWTDSSTTVGNRYVMAARSENGGKTFSKPSQISKGNVTSVAIHRQDVTVFLRGDGQCHRACFVRSTDGGETFTKPVGILKQANNIPAVVGHEKIIAAAWPDYPKIASDSDIYFVSSLNGGTPFSEPMNLSNSAGHSTAPHVATNSEAAFVAWREDTPKDKNGAPARSEIWMARIPLTKPAEEPLPLF